MNTEMPSNKEQDPTNLETLKKELEKERKRTSALATLVYLLYSEKREETIPDGGYSTFTSEVTEALKVVLGDEYENTTSSSGRIIKDTFYEARD